MAIVLDMLSNIYNNFWAYEETVPHIEWKGLLAIYFTKIFGFTRTLYTIFKMYNDEVYGSLYCNIINQNFFMALSSAFLLSMHIFEITFHLYISTYLYINGLGKKDFNYSMFVLFSVLIDNFFLLFGKLLIEKIKRQASLEYVRIENAQVNELLERFQLVIFQQRRTNDGLYPELDKMLKQKKHMIIINHLDSKQSVIRDEISTKKGEDANLDKEAECPICYEFFEGEEKYYLLCGHFTCRSCTCILVTDEHPKCSLCRKPIRL